MPVYEYFCRGCHTKYDKLRAMADADAPIACPECGEQNSVRALSLFAAHTGSMSELGGNHAESHSYSHGGCGCGGACACGRHGLN
jgi:putative FmdB family regulatory protein